ncbi:hypothetical protein NSP_36300 [Nodularia spumigena CCY9414]|nr:hypothetical protein NSP_36300 [Nodularia spumigena CCY9414]
MYLDHKLISVFISSFAPLRLCVRYKDVVHLAENRCKLMHYLNSITPPQ